MLIQVKVASATSIRTTGIRHSILTADVLWLRVNKEKDHGEESAD